MCVACIEFIKGTLNLGEFKSALRETTRDDEDHLTEVTQSLGDSFTRGSGDEKALREKLRTLSKK